MTSIEKRGNFLVIKQEFGIVMVRVKEVVYFRAWDSNKDLDEEGKVKDAENEKWVTVIKASNSDGWLIPGNHAEVLSEILVEDFKFALGTSVGVDKKQKK